MQKIISFILALAALCLVAIPVHAQLVTNNVKIVLTAEDDAALRLAWRLDSNARTNGIGDYLTFSTNGAPIISPTNALTYGQWQDWRGTKAFQDLADHVARQNEAKILEMYRTASDADRARVARILAGLAN